MFGGNPNKIQCEQDDCLHPCRGAGHESNCNMCLMYAYSKIKRGEDFLPLAKHEAAACDGCVIPHKEFSEYIPTFEEWMAEL